MNKHGTLLSSLLNCSVPLWVIKINEHYDADLFFERITLVQGVLETKGEALMFPVEGESANAFNALAEAIALLSFYKGGVTMFGGTYLAEKIIKNAGRKNNFSFLSTIGMEFGVP